MRTCAGLLLARRCLSGLDRQAGVAQAQGAVLGVPGIVDQQDGALALAAGQRGARLQVGQRGQESLGGAAQHQGGVLTPDAAQIGQHGVHLPGVVVRVVQRARVVAAFVVAGNQGETSQVLPVRLPGEAQQRQAQRRQRQRGARTGRDMAPAAITACRAAR